MTDAELVDAIRSGDREAASELVRRHLRGARAVALAIAGDLAAAEDISQEAFVHAIERLDDCRDPARFGAWLRQIVRNKARNHRRWRKLRAALSLDAAGEKAGPDSPVRDAERAELRERLLGALGQLPEDRREVVLLHDLEGWTHREIAERMDLPDGTVRSHLHLARKRLRELLGMFIGD